MKFLMFCLKCNAHMTRLNDNDKIYWECGLCQNKVSAEVVL